MDDCGCGAERRRFWLWRDSNGVIHASRFAPTAGAVASVMAATARDALLAYEGPLPRHTVTLEDENGTTTERLGRCSVPAAATA